MFLDLSGEASQSSKDLFFQNMDYIYPEKRLKSQEHLART